MNQDTRYIELAKACGVYGTDHLGDLLEFAYAVAKEERSRREWIGLTKEEIDSLWTTGLIVGWDPKVHRDFAQAIETKLKEKNT